MSQQSLEAAYLEKRVMDMLDHPTLAKCHASFEDSEHFVIVSEMMNCDMRTLMDHIDGPIREWYARKLFF